jgi:cytochrome c biogenesis protein CcmG/thiol:disulfide interchange protein DsbE
MKSAAGRVTECMSDSKIRTRLLVLGCGLVAILSTFAEHAPSSPSRTAAPEFKLQDANGAVVKLSDYRGKVVLLDFWATWCGGCRTEMPWFMEFERSYRDRGFAVVGVSMDEDGWRAVKPFIAERKINYRVLLGNERIARLYGGLEALPVTLLIDRDGKIVSKHVGTEAGKEGFRREIEALMTR